MIWAFILAVGTAGSEKSVSTQQHDSSPDSKRYTVLTGKLLKQRYIEDIQKSQCIDGSLICLNAYFRSFIEVDEVIVGELDTDALEAISYQHNYSYADPEETVVLVISEMVNQNSIDLFGTHFYAEEISIPETRQCLKRSLSEYLPGLAQSPKCHVLHGSRVIENNIARYIRGNLLDELFEKYEGQLQFSDWLISADFEWTNGIDVINTDDIDKQCEVLGLAEDDANVDCDYSELFDAQLFKLSKGQGEAAMELFKQELKASRLNLKPFDIRYRIIEHGEHSEFQVHYKY